MYNYAGSIEVPSRADDEIANIVASRFNEAVRWQASERVGKYTLKETLRNCYDQYNGILSCEDQEIVEALGVDAYVNLSQMKCGLVQSYLLEALVPGDELPWFIQPTPLPDLSARGTEEALSRVIEMVTTGGFRGDLLQLVGQTKRAIYNEEMEVAKKRAANMERLITDQCLEGGWNDSMYGFVNDFTTYPYAVLHGPIVSRKPRLVWNDDTLTTRYENFYKFKSVSPWDFWYSPDSPDSQRGTCVFVRERWTRRNLLEAAKIESYREDTIREILSDAENAEDSGFKWHWTSENPDQPDTDKLAWHHCGATVDVLIHYGFLSGRELYNAGVTDVEFDQFYNAQVTIVDSRVIQVVVNKNPNIQMRPVNTASFYKARDRIANYAIPQRIRDVERCYMTALRYMMTNAASASGPVVEADYTRLSRYMSEEDIGRVVPNMMYLSDSGYDGMPSNRAALQFHSIPSNIASYMQILDYFMGTVDLISNIPAALHGTAQGSGALRTFRGAAMLQGNAVKAISAAVLNIDRSVFGNVGTQLYNYNMQYEDDPDIKGDCKVIAQGSSGLLQREIDRQNSFEVLQLVGSAGNALSQEPEGQAIIKKALADTLGIMGFDETLVDNYRNSNSAQGQAPEAALSAGPEAVMAEPGMSVPLGG